jgi:hypothetical protein
MDKMTEYNDAMYIDELRKRVKTLESMGTSESARLSKLLIEARARIEELEEKIKKRDEEDYDAYLDSKEMGERG